jgi:hypothetical protein
MGCGDDEEWGDDEEYGDFSDQPPPEFDRDAERLLWSSDLREEDREAILREARRRLASGEPKEVVSDWLWRKVSRTAYGAWGFDAYDENFKVIVRDPTHVIGARKYIAAESGAKRQDKRNSDFDRLIERCQQLVDEGYAKEDIVRECYVFIGGIRKRRGGASYPVFQHRFGGLGLPRISGRKAKSIPDWRRFRQRLMKALKSGRDASSASRGGQ